MNRRTFVRLLAVVPVASRARADTAVPRVRIVTPHRALPRPGMPGRYPGAVVSVRSDRALDPATWQTNAEAVREMMARGMCAMTGMSNASDAWRQFFTPSDVVGIKVNCGGHPHVVSDHEIVAETVLRLLDVGVPATQIYIYER